MSDSGGLWKHENNQHTLVPPKSECGWPSGGGMKNGHIVTLPLLCRNAEEEEEEARTQSAAVQLVSSFFLNRFYLCHSFIACILPEELLHLRINARYICFREIKERLRQSVTPLLLEVYWLPVNFRIECKTRHSPPLLWWTLHLL